MVFSPAKLAEALLERDDEEIVSLYLRDIEELFPGFPDVVVESQVRRFPMGLPYCFPGRGKLQSSLMRPQGRIHLAGDYLGTFYTETAIETGSQAASRILEQLREEQS